MLRYEFQLKEKKLFKAYLSMGAIIYFGSLLICGVVGIIHDKMFNCVMTMLIAIICVHILLVVVVFCCFESDARTKMNLLWRDH